MINYYSTGIFGYVLISSFTSVVGTPIVIVSTAIALKTVAASVASKNINPSKEKLMKHGQIIELTTNKLVVLEELASKAMKSLMNNAF